MKSPQMVALLLVLGILGGCTKLNQTNIPLLTKVAGRVLIKGTDHPASQFPLTVRVYKYADQFNMSIGQLVVETKTDSLGRYRLSFESREPQARYYLSLEEELAHCFAPNERRVYIESNKSQHRDLFYIPQAWLKLHIRRDLAHPEDELRVFMGGKELYTFKGKTDEVLFCGPKPGNTTLLVTSGLRRAGKLQFTRADTLFLAAYDTSYQLLQL